MRSASAIFMSRTEAIMCLPQIVTLYMVVKQEWGAQS